MRNIYQCKTDLQWQRIVYLLLIVRLIRTINYIDNWNQAEDEFASLLHVTITRPIPTVVTIGGVIGVTYLLDMPHGFEWKGVFVDAGLRAVSVQPSAVSTDDRQKTFMQLSALQGSILENRIFEDDFQVESISTAKLIQLCKQQSAGSCQVITIDRTNIAAVLPTLTLDDNIREDIINTVNQGFIVRIPQPLTPDPQSLITYEDWSGIGYIKENPETGEVGYMLSGMLVPFTELAGGMTAINKENWKNQDFANKVGKITGKTTNQKPEEAVRIVRLNKNRSDYQDGIVGTGLKTSLEVIALDGEGNPVQNLKLSFTISAGAGKLQGVNKAGNPVKDVNTGSSAPASQVTLTTGPDGVARARLTLGQQTEVSPYYVQKTNASGDKYWELVGLNLVSVSASTTRARMTTDKPFEAYGKPGAATELIKLNPTTDIYGPPSILASPVWVKIIDQYGNPISDKNVKFSIRRDYLGTPPATGAISAKLFGELSECPGVATIDCPYAKEADVTPFEKRTEYFGIYPYLIMGNTEDTKFTVTATANKDSFDSKGKRIDNNTALNSVVFTFYTKLVENGYVAVDSPYFVDGKGNKIDAGKAGETFPQPISAVMYYTERTREGTFKVMPVVKELPPGSPLKNDAKVEFQVYAGGGSANPVLQTQETDGYYSTTLKLGDTPGKNRINAIGSVTASVPAYDSQGNVTRTDKMLVAYYPIEIWGVKLTVPSYQQVVLNSEGYPVADVEFKYDIDPLDYQFTPANLGVEIYEKSATGSESLMGFVPADSNLKTILSKGMAKFSPDNTYYAQVVLNRGTKTEVRSEKVPLLNAVLIPDYDRNGNIDDADRERAARGDTFYFWINDDDDEGETGGTDVPGEIHFSDGLLDYGSKSVDGVRDLIDFFPVHLDIKDLLRVYDPAQYKYVLKSEFNNVNIVLTDMTDKKTRAYLTGNDDSLEPALTLSGKITNQVLFSGLVLNSLEGGQTFLQKIRDEEGKGIIICEGRLAGKAPLVLEVIDSENKSVLSLSMNLSLSGVEEMFRHENLSRVTNQDLVPGPGSIAGEIDRLEMPKNCPDFECTGISSINGKNFVYIHGYGNNGQEARGRQVETFKRMFWSGSKAKFYGVTWYGWDSQHLGVTMNFHVNVQHAFATVPALKAFLYNDVAGEVTIAAHSLGNMIVSAMLTDNADGWDASGKIKSYFMLDAAVAAEAYGFADDYRYPELIEKDTHSDMTHPSWNGYEKRLWSSEWHLLFDDTDNRKKLTWRNIFKDRPSKVTYYNFYSTGEEVLDVHKDEPNILDIGIFSQTGQYAWALQEKLKGDLKLNSVLGSGWGFNLTDYYDKDLYLLTQEYKIIQSAATYNISNVQLRTKPFFLKGNEGDLFEEATGSNYAFQNKIRLLADAIPARTLAAGKKEVLKLGPVNEFNFDMQTTYKTTKKVNGIDVVFWPSSRGKKENWWHGDAREVAYSYVYLLFDKFVGLGGLK